MEHNAWFAYCIFCPFAYCIFCILCNLRNVLCRVCVTTTLIRKRNVSNEVHSVHKVRVLVEQWRGTTHWTHQANFGQVSKDQGINWAWHSVLFFQFFKSESFWFAFRRFVICVLCWPNDCIIEAVLHGFCWSYYFCDTTSATLKHL